MFQSNILILYFQQIIRDTNLIQENFCCDLIIGTCGKDKKSQGDNVRVARVLA